jgi:cell wall-associated NlpC family hydrolase
MDRRKSLLALAFASAWLAGCATAPTSGRREDTAGDGTGRKPPPDDDSLDPNRLEIVMLALGQIGVPYVWGGTSPHRGFDCSGLVAYVFRQGAQLALPRTAFEQARMGRSTDDGQLRPADLVFYNTLGREYSHVGIYIGDDRFVHAPARRGVVRVEPMRLGFWRDRFNGARRILG